MKKVGTFYGHLEYMTAIWYILWPFDNLVAIWCKLHREKSGNPGLAASEPFLLNTPNRWCFDF
jgi:hypothetical protein